MLVSVIIPAYNAEATLAETLASIRAQTLAPDQVIVVDDGSSDTTAELAKSFGCDLIRHAANQGVSAAINTGLKLCFGEAVAILDADDLWPSNALQSQVQMLHKTGSDAVVGQVQEFVCPSVAQGSAESLPRPIQLGWLYGATLVRRNVLYRVGEFDSELRIGAWVDWVGRARSKNVVFGTNPEVVLHRRLRPGSLSSNSSQRTADMLRIARAAVLRSRG